MKEIQRWYLQITGEDGCATGGFMKAVGGPDASGCEYDPRKYGHIVYVTEADYAAERTVLLDALRIDLLSYLDSLTQYKEPCTLLWGIGHTGDDGWTKMEPSTKAAIRSSIDQWLEARALLAEPKEKEHAE